MGTRIVRVCHARSSKTFLSLHSRDQRKSTFCHIGYSNNLTACSVASRLQASGDINTAIVTRQTQARVLPTYIAMHPRSNASRVVLYYSRRISKDILKLLYTLTLEA